MNIRKFKAALIGLGQRGMRLYYAAIRERKDVEIVAFCDSFEPRLKEFAEKVKKDDGITPSLYTDYKKCLDESGCNCVIVATAWTDHIPVSVYAMERGIAVGCEVGGGYSLESLWELVRCYERTETPIMLLENCC